MNKSTYALIAEGVIPANPSLSVGKKTVVGLTFGYGFVFLIEVL